MTDTRFYRSVRLAALCLCFCAGLSSTQASAQADGDALPEDRAFELYQEAADDFKARNFAAAVAKLERAYELFPKAIILIKLAEGLEHLGHIEEAQARFADVEPEDEEMRLRVAASLRRLGIQLARPVSVSILTPGLSDVRVVLDGLDLGRSAPAVIEIPRGRHVLQLFKPGYEVFVVDPFEVKGSATVVVEAVLVPLRYPVSVHLGPPSRGTTVMLDGSPVSLSRSEDPAFARIEATLGEHTLTCLEPDGSSRSHSFSVTMQGKAAVSCIDDGAASRVLGLSLAIGGSVIFAAGTGLLVWHAVDVDFAARNNLEIEYEAIPHRDIIGPSMMGAGVALSLLSLLFLLDDDESGEAGVALRPSWAPSSAGGVWGLAGRF